MPCRDGVPMPPHWGPSPDTLVDVKIEEQETEEHKVKIEGDGLWFL